MPRRAKSRGGRKVKGCARLKGRAWAPLPPGAGEKQLGKWGMIKTGLGHLNDLRKRQVVSNGLAMAGHHKLARVAKFFGFGRRRKRRMRGGIVSPPGGWTLEDQKRTGIVF